MIKDPKTASSLAEGNRVSHNVTKVKGETYVDKFSEYYCVQTLLLLLLHVNLIHSYKIMRSYHVPSQQLIPIFSLSPS
jgi:hypothetical protein